jgi:hypothetical protein
MTIRLRYRVSWNIVNIYTQDDGHLQVYYILCAGWVLFVMSDSSSRFLPAPWGCCLLLCWRLTAYLAPCLEGRVLARSSCPGWPQFPRVPGTFLPLCWIHQELSTKGGGGFRNRIIIVCIFCCLSKMMTCFLLTSPNILDGNIPTPCKTFQDFHDNLGFSIPQHFPGLSWWYGNI